MLNLFAGLLLISMLSACETTTQWNDLAYDMSPNELFALSGAPEQ